MRDKVRKTACHESVHCELEVQQAGTQMVTRVAEL